MNKYESVFSGLSFSPEQKAQIAARAAEEVISSRRSKQSKFFSLSRIAALAACLVLVLAVSVEAAGIPTPLSGLLAPIFGGTVAQTEVIDKIGHPIDAGDTDNGVTISAQAILGDKYNACIVFSIRRDDGEPILPEGANIRALQIGGFGNIDLIRMGGAHGSARFVDLVPGDNEIHYIYSISADEPLNHGTAKVSFENLYCWPEREEEKEKILDGKWQFRFEVDYEDASIRLGNGETFEQEAMRFTITEILISPISVWVSYEVDSEVLWSNGPSGRMPEEDRREMERYLEHVPLLLTKKDGTILDLSAFAGGGIHPEDGKTYCTKSTVLDEILPLEELESITVGDIVYPVG